MKNTGTTAINVIIVILMIIAVVAIGLGVWLQIDSIGESGFAGIVLGVACLVLSGLMRGFRTIVEAAALYISKNS